LAALTRIGLLRAKTILANIFLHELLTRRTHPLLLHEGQKGWLANITRLEKMGFMLLFQTL